MHDVIVKALITEKSMQLVGKNKFTFLVSLHANKNVIRKAIENAFSVHVVTIETVTIKGKTKRVGTRRSEVTIAPQKRAIVTLKAGEKIDIFELGS